MPAIKKIILFLVELLGGFSLLQWKNRQQPLILMYHRIIDDPIISGVHPSVFEQQMAYLVKHFRVVPISTLLHELATNTLKPSTVALTFDDGHYDFYENAWPILKKYQLPSSLYITTGFVDGDQWLWPDLLKYILDNNKKDELLLPGLDTLWITKHNLQECWHRLGDYCLTLKTDKRNAFLKMFAEVASVTVPSIPTKSFSAVTWQQLQQMQSEGLVVGSHTVSHPILSSLNEQDLHYELQHSATTIEKNLGVFPQGICYPNGRPEDINTAVIESVKKTGYRYGLMARKMSVNKEQQFILGRQAANLNFNYFKWTLSRRQNDMQNTYIQ